MERIEMLLALTIIIYVKPILQMGYPDQVPPPRMPYNPPPVIPVSPPPFKDAAMNGSTRSLVVKVKYIYTFSY